MNKAILNTDIQAFIQANLNIEIPVLSLSKSPFQLVSSKELAEQIDSKKRCEHKLPLWFNTPGIYYPKKLAIEQASSEITARYKANLIIGDQIIDLTGGIGIDSYFFALKAKEVTHCELNTELSDISEYNAGILDVKIDYKKVNGLEYLRSSDKIYSSIYVDPSRRVDSKKVFLLKDCEPDLISNMNLLKSRSSHIIIKTAPLLDIQSTLTELKEVRSVHIVSIKNECKELLYLIDTKIKESDPLIHCVLLGSEKEKSYSFRLSEEKLFQVNAYSAPLSYIYEPDAALLKAGCFKLISRDFDVQKLQQHTHLYTSNTLISFPGRTFKLKSSSTYGDFVKENTIKKANIICRNFPMSPQVIKKKLKINDGGQEYLLFCTGAEKELLVLHCERLS